MMRITIGRYRKESPSASAVTLKSERRVSLRAVIAGSIAPLPLAGRGWGWGYHNGVACGLPPSLTHKGGGKETARVCYGSAPSRLLQLPPLQAVVRQQGR